MLVEFEKWHGCKNDFIVVWTSQSQYKNIGSSLQRQAVDLCSRYSGIGADGLMILINAPNHDIPEKLVIINSDGSNATTCGNGIRCAALSVYQHVLKKGKTLESVELEVEDLKYTCQFIPQKGSLPLVQVNMGLPLLDDQNAWHKEALSFVESKLEERKLEHLLPNLHTFSIANQHLIFLLEEEEEIRHMRELGQSLQSFPHWGGINVSFASPLDSSSYEMPIGMRNLEKSDAYKVFVWERGAGETQACGSAACGVTRALLDTGLISRSSWVPMLFPGGWLFAKQDASDEEMILCGPGKFVFSGNLDF